ncbi:MAG: hypothetical protein KC736_04400 [Candidatus Moranbacteria bacterium]|nr:hypothetical protein [Candidatus Moranbacteria bacterium]
MSHFLRGRSMFGFLILVIAVLLFVFVALYFFRMQQTGPPSPSAPEEVVLENLEGEELRLAQIQQDETKSLSGEMIGGQIVGLTEPAEGDYRIVDVSVNTLLGGTISELVSSEGESLNTLALYVTSENLEGGDLSTIQMGKRVDAMFGETFFFGEYVRPESVVVSQFETIEVFETSFDDMPELEQE